MKVPFLPLALLAAVAGKLTARTMFKVLSFFRWMLTIRTDTIYTCTAHNYKYDQNMTVLVAVRAKIVAVVVVFSRKLVTKR